VRIEPVPRTLPIVLVSIAAAAAILSASAAPAAAPALSVVAVQPVVGTKVPVERVAADGATRAQAWRMNLDVSIKNADSRSYTLERVSIGYPNAPVTVFEKSYAASEAVTIAPGKTVTIPVPENRDIPFPVAPQVRVTFDFGAQAVIVTKLLAEHVNPVRGSGAYLFPGARADLPDGQYWTDNQNHLVGTDHRNVAHQRFAYDFNVRRWTGKQWTTLKSGGSGSKNEDFLIFGLPIHAVAGGRIEKCRRDRPENTPGTEGEEGNGLWIRSSGTDELVFYAHMKQNSIPPELCPKEKDISIPVVAGQTLGAVGNSGSSSGPHLHIEAYRVDSAGNSQGVPMHFRNIRTVDAGGDWKRAAPCDPASERFATSPKAAVGWRQLVEPLWPAGARELSRHGMAEACFQDFGEGAVASGYRPMWFDGYDVGGKPYVNAVFRPGPASGWVLRTGLSATAYQAELTSSYDKGYRPTLVESYLVGPSPRYAFLAEKRQATVFAYHGRSATEHQKLADDYAAKGYAPVAVAVVSRKGTLLYTALWEKKPFGSWAAKSTLTSAAYQKWLEDNARDGRRLVYVDAYHHDGASRFSAIVSSATPTAYAARHDLTSDAYQSEFETWTGKGLRTQVTTGYAVGNAHRFAALWR